MPEKCHVINCTEPAVAKGLCRKHYMQVKRHGEVKDARPSDWGKREKHPAYKVWCNLRRHYRETTAQTWLDNFWQFVQDIPGKPKMSTAFRPDKLQPWSKSNFYWKEHRSSSAERKEYSREWQQKSRAANPDYYLTRQLQKTYGITLEWYRKILTEQNGVCAICKKPETTQIRGKTIAMSVDHCHTSGKARGLLCTQCNRGLRLFKDDPEILQSAISYLRKQNG